MTDLRKAAEMALEKLTALGYTNPQQDDIDQIKYTLRQALAQPELKPVAWMHCLPDGHNVVSTSDESAFIDGFTGTYSIIPLYTTPPKREWQGLTDEEIYATYDETKQTVDDSWAGSGAVGLMFPISLYKAIEAKLKEKNT